MRSSKVWKVREDYRSLVKKAKKLFPTLLEHIKVDRIFLCSFTSRRSRHMAKIGPNRMPWSLIIPDYDYFIQFWQSGFDRSTHEYKLFVVVHELFHIPRGGFKVGFRKEYRRLLDHDLEDFLFLRQVYGLQLESVKDILQGEKVLLKSFEGTRRFPRIAKIK